MNSACHYNPRTPLPRCILLVFLRLLLSQRSALLAENLFLRRQLAMFRERGVRPRRASRIDRAALVVLAKCFASRDALFAISPRTLIRWQRDLVRHLWSWKSRPLGRPRLPQDVQDCILRMARENHAWSTRRIANELQLGLGVRVSPQTIRRYLPADDPRRRRMRRRPRNDQRWSTFVHNHARKTVACDFVVTMTTSLRSIYIFVVMEIESRRILHINATSHPTAAWTAQQLRDALAGDATHRFMIHDRDAIFSDTVDATIRSFGIEPMLSPPRSPKANAFCERLIGTLRRECLDFIIPLGEDHIRRVVREWSNHYNRGRPHMSLGPSVPEPSDSIPLPLPETRHTLRAESIVSRPILGGIHHEYRYDEAA